MLPLLFLLAEIMDKEPTVVRYWAIAVCLTLVSFLVVRWRPWTFVVALPLVLLYISEEFFHVNDPCFREAIVYEAGWGYVVQVHASLAMVLVGPLVPILRADLPIARAWWSSVTARRTRTVSGAAAPYRSSVPAHPPAPSPWRLVLTFVVLAASLLALALLQWHRAQHRCTWEP